MIPFLMQALKDQYNELLEYQLLKAFTESNFRLQTKM